MSAPSSRSVLFAQETAVVRDDRRAGRWTARLSHDWGAPTLPQGGLVTAVACRAMRAELDAPEQRLRSVTTVFAAPVQPGPIEIDVAVLRRGRSLSQATATLRNAGETTGHTSVAVFGGVRDGFEFTELAPPRVPPPDQCPSFRNPPPGWQRRIHFPYWDHVQSHIALGHAVWDAWEPTTSERAYWYRFDDPPVGEDGLLDPLAVVTLCDTMPGAVGERMGPAAPFWLPPSADITIHLLGDAGPGWLLCHNRARWAGDGYASVEMALWDPERGLVAHATQVMVFTFPDGPPTPGQRRPPPLPA